jgi:hypothetical protein
MPEDDRPGVVCPGPAEWEIPFCVGGPVYTRVTEFAAAPNGDVYFLDANTNRIGLIRHTDR